MPAEQRDPEEHTVSGLLRKLERDADATPEHLRLVSKLLHFYQAQGVIGNDEWARPLHEACPDCGACWPPQAPRPANPLLAEVAVPWIGPDYFNHRICAVAINGYNWTPLGANWWLVRGHIHDRLEKGTRRNFEFRVGQYLAAVASSELDRPLSEQNLEAGVAAQGWRSCAFLEGLKCAPVGTRVGTPTEAMWKHCPPRYLVGELSLLEPRTVVAVGVRVGEWLSSLLKAEPVHEAPGLRVERARINGGETRLLRLNHPSYGHWKASLPSLLEHLFSTARPAVSLRGRTA